MLSRTCVISSRAFTLVELLVVVAILALLISILLPALGQARASAKQATCSARLYQLGTAIYCYWTEWNERVPYVESPMTNGTMRPGFGNPASTPEETDPFDRARWPLSLPNVLMPKYIGASPELFACPAALLGWPRGAAPRYSYRDAAANQPYGAVLDPQRYWYFREHFAFMDGRVLRKLRPKLTGNPLHDAQLMVLQRGTFLRDLVRREGNTLTGPHRGGNNVLTRELQVEFRDQQTTQEDLAPHYSGGVDF